MVDTSLMTDNVGAAMGRFRWILTRVALMTGTAPVVGCLHFGPDPRDYHMTDLPAIPSDVKSAAVVQTGPTIGEPPPTKGAKTQPEVPKNLPGSEAPPLTAIPRNVEMKKGRFPTLPPLEADPALAASPTGQPLTLSDLEQIALKNSPTIRQAAADVEVARGRAVQAGLPPNPAAGYQADQINSGVGKATRGQQGGYVEFTIKGPGKLSLSRQIGMMDYFSAQVAFRRAQLDVLYQVRSNYFALLVAKESLAVNKALAQFTEGIYRSQIGLVRGGEQAPYEPLQSYVLAVQARALAVQARNRYSSAWRQLAAAMSEPNMPPTEFAGRADAPLPTYDYDKLKEMTFANHTDLQIAQNRILQARYSIRLADITPIPDIFTHIYVEKDWSTPPYNTQVGVQTGGNLPLFDRNQGNKLAARATLARAIQDVTRVQNDLATQLAQSYESYQNARDLVVYYRNEALPNLVVVYRAVYQRYMQDPANVSYNEVVTAQQNLANGLTTYLNFLNSQWTAVVDLANLVQSDEIYLMGPETGNEVGLEQMIAPMPPQVGPPPAAPKDAKPAELPKVEVKPEAPKLEVKPAVPEAPKPPAGQP